LNGLLAAARRPFNAKMPFNIELPFNIQKGPLNNHKRRERSPQEDAHHTRIEDAHHTRIEDAHHMRIEDAHHTRIEDAHPAHRIEHTRGTLAKSLPTN